MVKSSSYYAEIVAFDGERCQSGNEKGLRRKNVYMCDMSESERKEAAFARRKRRKAAGGKQTGAFPWTPSCPYAVRKAAAYVWRLWLQRISLNIRFQRKKSSQNRRSCSYAGFDAAAMLHYMAGLHELADG